MIGIIAGVYNGKCCGIMGIMEGMMAGIMGGVMGSMIGVMFRVDYINIFMPFFMLANIMVMFGLSYMLFEEIVEDNINVRKKSLNFSKFFSYFLIINLILILIMVYGPKTGLARLM